MNLLCPCASICQVSINCKYCSVFYEQWSRSVIMCFCNFKIDHKFVDHWITICQIANNVEFSYGTVQTILTEDLSKIVSQLLTLNKKLSTSYPLDLAICDFFLFSKIKSKLKRQRFDIVEKVNIEA